MYSPPTLNLKASAGQDFRRRRPWFLLLWFLGVFLLAGNGAIWATGPLYEVKPENLKSQVKPIKSTKPDRIKGVLPKGWEEDSAWADVWIEYSLEKGLSGQPESYLRARIDKMDRGHGQIKLPFSGKEGQQYLKFTMRARSTTTSSIQLMVRQSAAPYKAFWQKNIKLDSIWRDYDFDVELNSADPKLAAIIQLKGGKVDIAALHLSQRSKDEVIHQLKKKYPDGGPKNLLTHSRFPAGLPAGWTYAAASSLGDELIVEPDLAKEAAPEIPAVDGVAPLRVRTSYAIPREDGKESRREAELGLCTAPFTLAAPYEANTFSAYFAGDLKDGKISVFADGQGIKDFTFTVTPEEGWKRVSFNFMPKLLGRQYVVKLDARGEFWLDGWQVNTGDKPAPFATTAAGEVTLVFGNPSRVIFGGDVIPLRAVITNFSLPAEGLALAGEIRDAYGVVTKLPRLPLGNVPVSELNLGETLTVPTRYGPKHISVWVEAGGKRLSSKEELVFNVVPKPLSWGRDMPGSFFGAHLPPTARHIQMAKSIGVDWVRLQDDALDATAWASVEPSPGEWIFPDAWVNRYRRGNLLILGRLSTTPEWARLSDYRESNHGVDLYFQAADSQDFATYADKVVGHYAGKVAAWDVWQRPWDRMFRAYDKDAKNWGDKYVQVEDPLAVYAEYSRLAAEAVEKHDPSALLVGISGNYRGRGERWLEQATTAGLVEGADVIGFQAYWTVDRGNLVDPSSNFSALINRNILDPLLKYYPRFPRPLWMTEATFSLGPYEQGMHSGGSQDQLLLWTLADRAVRFCVAAQSLGVEKVFFYSMERGEFLGMPHRGARASLVGEDSFLAPSGVALAVFARQTAERRLVKRLQISPDVFLALYDGRDGALGVLIPTEGEQLPDLADFPEARLADIFGNPLQSVSDQSAGSSVYLNSTLTTAALEAKLREILPPLPVEPSK